MYDMRRLFKDRSEVAYGCKKFMVGLASRALALAHFSAETPSTCR
jgi:hypothetical protein